MEREIKGLLSERTAKEAEAVREKEKDEKSDLFESPSPEVSEKVSDIDENADGNDEEKKGDRAHTPDDTENVSVTALAACNSIPVSNTDLLIKHFIIPISCPLI